MSDKVYVGPKVQSFARGREYAPVSRVTMWYDDEHYYTAGDDSGREISCENPWATQEMVNNVYRQLKGFVYRPFEASGVEIDPAFELGDAVTVGGIYSFVGHATQHFDAMGGTDISLPGEQEVDHEYPYVSPQERELKRRVKLGQKYQGVSIDRRNGLTIVETDGESEGAKVVLNSRELSFYDAGGGRVLYFDPASGTYKFLGEVNVNDKFVVDKAGNVTLAGNINMTDGVITWGGNGPVKYQFAASLTGPWHDTYATNDEYRRESFDGGTTWEAPYKLVGKDGRPGSDGSDATVNYKNIKSALEKAADIQDAFMSVNEMGAPEIFGGKIYGAEIYAGGVGEKGGQIIGLTDNGITIFDGYGADVLVIYAEGNQAKMRTSMNALTISTPYLHLSGSNTTYFHANRVDFTDVSDIDFTGVSTKGLHATFA